MNIILCGGFRSVRVKCALALLAFLLLAGICPSARANVTINPIYDTTIVSDPNAATIESSIQTSINNLEADLSNNVTIDITFKEMSSGLGESNTVYYDTSYASYLTALQHNQTLTSNDNLAIASLGSGTAVNPVNGNASIIANAALLEALGVNVQGDGPLTGIITGTISLNTSIMNLSRSGTQNPGDYDIQAVTTHELDEVVGGIGGAGSSLLSGTGNPVGPLDLFRYSASGVRSYTQSTTAVSYFSINGGATDLVHFNQNGTVDNSDFGDWGNGNTPAQQAGNSPPQVQDAYGDPGVDTNLGANEMTAYDIVGWNLTAQGQTLEGIPEPKSIYLVAAGGLAAFVIHRRRRKAA